MFLPKAKEGPKLPKPNLLVSCFVHVQTGPTTVTCGFLKFKGNTIYNLLGENNKTKKVGASFFATVGLNLNVSNVALAWGMCTGTSSVLSMFTPICLITQIVPFPIYCVNSNANTLWYYSTAYQDLCLKPQQWLHWHNNGTCRLSIFQFCATTAEKKNQLASDLETKINLNKNAIT